MQSLQVGVEPNLSSPGLTSAWVCGTVGWICATYEMDYEITHSMSCVLTVFMGA